MTGSDEDLIRESQRGNPEAFNAIVDRYQRRLFAVAYGMVHDSDDARELVQEALIRAYRAQHGFRGDARLYTWLYRIAVNTCLDFLRRRGKERASQDPGDDVDIPAASNPEALASRRETQRMIRRAMQGLPREQRIVLTLREIDELSYKEISEIVGASIGTVMSRIFYGRRKLRELLKSYGEAD